MNKVVPQIETKRLTLRGIDEQDTDFIVKWRSAPNVYRYLSSPHPLTAEEHEKWFREVYSHDLNRWDWLASTKLDKAAVGVFGVKRKREEEKSIEVSYLLAPDAQHKGYASEAMKGLLKWEQEHCEARTAIANIHKDNAASLKFIERLNFQRDGEEGSFVIYRKIL